MRRKEKAGRKHVALATAALWKVEKPKCSLEQMISSHREKMAPAFLSGDFGSNAPPALERFEAFAPDNGDTIWSDGDKLVIGFNMPTDEGRTAGGRAFVDNLLDVSDELGVEYSGECAA